MSDCIFPSILKFSPADPGPIGSTETRGGLTKRELFAAMAMQAFLSRDKDGTVSLPDRAASLAVCYADALLDELAKEKAP